MSLLIDTTVYKYSCRCSFIQQSISIHVVVHSYNSLQVSMSLLIDTTVQQSRSIHAVAD